MSTGGVPGPGGSVSGGSTPPPAGGLLLQAVCILLECILGFNFGCME